MYSGKDYGRAQEESQRQQEISRAYDYNNWDERNQVLNEGLRAGLSELEIIVKLCEQYKELSNETLKVYEKYRIPEQMMNDRMRGKQ